VGGGVESSICCLVVFSIDYEVRIGVNQCRLFVIFKIVAYAIGCGKNWSEPVPLYSKLSMRNS